MSEVMRILFGCVVSFAMCQLLIGGGIDIDKWRFYAIFACGLGLGFYGYWSAIALEKL